LRFAFGGTAKNGRSPWDETAEAKIAPIVD